MIDEAKAWRAHRAPRTFLVAVPSIWGSGAEASPVIVLDHNGAKEIHIGNQYLPDVRCVWPELASSLSPEQALYACGDAWSHALEGFLSPLAGHSLREDLASVLVTMKSLPVSNDSRWFEPSAAACAGQARSSVGLVHGIAHTLEPVMRASYPREGWGHARLCATFVWPVMRYNQARGDRWTSLTSQYGLDGSAMLDCIESLHDSGNYETAMAHMEGAWKEVLRDPCTRTNSTLVRPDSLAWFMNRAFL